MTDVIVTLVAVYLIGGLMGLLVDWGGPLHWSQEVYFGSAWVGGFIFPIAIAAYLLNRSWLAAGAIVVLAASATVGFAYLAALGPDIVVHEEPNQLASELERQLRANMFQNHLAFAFERYRLCVFIAVGLVVVWWIGSLAKSGKG